MKRIAPLRAPLLALLTLALGACQDTESNLVGPEADIPAAFARGGNGGKPSGGPSAQRIAYAVTGPDSRIHTVDPDGTGAAAVANTEGGSDPAWSPDRKKLAFAIESGVDAGIYVVNANGRQRTRLYSGVAGSPAWSPDGTRIAFHANRPGGIQVLVMNRDGSNLQEATAVGTVNRDPAWSPDGTRMAYISNRPNGQGIWVMNANGTNRQRILTCYECLSPTWSPVVGDERIAFAVYHEGSLTEAGIGLIHTDGTNHEIIAYGLSHGTRDVHPAWSPDATRLVFSSGLLGGIRDLLRVNDDGTEVQRVMAAPGIEFAPAWAR